MLSTNAEYSSGQSASGWTSTSEHNHAGYIKRSRKHDAAQSLGLQLFPSVSYGQHLKSDESISKT